MNKKGLSTIVTVLIIILLTLVAIGIIWGVVDNLLSKSKSSVESSTKCLDVDMKATAVTHAAGTGIYNVTIKRAATGEGMFRAKVVISGPTGTGNVIDCVDATGVAFDFNPLDTKVCKVTGYGITDGNKVEVTPYYLDDSNAEKLCPTTKTFEF